MAKRARAICWSAFCFTGKRANKENVSIFFRASATRKKYSSYPMKFILAKKEGMTRVFGEDGRARAATVLKAAPVVVTQVKTKEGKDGYTAVQIGAGARKTKNISKAVLGHTKGKGFTTIR